MSYKANWHKYDPSWETLLPEWPFRSMPPVCMDSFRKPYLKLPPQGKFCEGRACVLFIVSCPVPGTASLLCILQTLEEWSNKYPLYCFPSPVSLSTSGFSIFGVWKPSPEQRFFFHLMKMRHLGLTVPLILAAKHLRASSEVHFLPAKAFTVHTIFGSAFCSALTMVYYFPFTLVIFSCLLSLLSDTPRGAKIIFTTQVCKTMPFFFNTTFLFIFQSQFLG